MILGRGWRSWGSADGEVVERGAGIGMEGLGFKDGASESEGGVERR